VSIYKAVSLQNEFLSHKICQNNFIISSWAGDVRERGARMHNYVFEIDVQNWQLEGKNQSITTNEGTDGAKHKICSKTMIPKYQ
jgi:hypothetical protein